MQTTTHPDASQTIHANISTEMKQSVRDWCQRNDLTESQLVRKAINLILEKALQS
jgi:hypothetical protein